MAHIIGSKPTAARGTPEGGEDTYDNLILLCPTHHTHIDKAPAGTYPIELLHEWKRAHEETISNAASSVKFESFAKLRIAVVRLLEANRLIFETYGPHSSIAQSDPDSNAYLIWELKRIDQIVPNNKKILNILDSNADLIDETVAITAIEKFRVHAESYERHVYHRLDSYELFPKELYEIFPL
ncbi:TPA: HNH endonuclease [Pseudomonas aeruginosa]|nr:HNH endonuclease [Pseudomonas aeruginosa]ELK6189194.1 HNH endonuclease [Pseudomonas aeruginosa]ELK6190181.1 HNH endonuclease [Pseudomonas aeruginosa]KSO41633.1 HNH endonuclease [Pseudomonas aeruginosa]MBG4559737.1 HNH endonuclease [Pseudomonas aeruginosa]